MDTTVPGARVQGSAWPSWHSQQGICPPAGPAPSRKETLVEETTAESSDDEVVPPSQVAAEGRAGKLRGLRTGASGQALPTQCSLRVRSPPRVEVRVCRKGSL